MIVVIDNRDSFVFNLARYLRLLGGARWPWCRPTRSTLADLAPAAAARRS